MDEENAEEFLLEAGVLPVNSADKDGPRNRKTIRVFLLLQQARNPQYHASLTQQRQLSYRNSMHSRNLDRKVVHLCSSFQTLHSIFSPASSPSCLDTGQTQTASVALIDTSVIDLHNPYFYFIPSQSTCLTICQWLPVIFLIKFTGRTIFPWIFSHNDHTCLLYGCLEGRILRRWFSFEYQE